MDRFDSRWDDDRDRTQSADRDWGGRSGRGSDDPRRDHGRSAFMRDLDLPGGDERVRLRVRGRDYDLDGADTEALATIGAFRVVQVEDLRDALEAGPSDATHDQRTGRLQDEGLLERIPLDGRERDVVVLTDHGRELLEAHRLGRPDAPRQAFYAGLTGSRGNCPTTRRSTAPFGARKSASGAKAGGCARRPRLRAEARLPMLPARA